MEQPKKMGIIGVVNRSLEWEGEPREFDVDIKLEVDGVEYRAYSVSIGYRDLLFYTDKGVLSYVVDSYGDRHSIELYDME